MWEFICADQCVAVVRPESTESTKQYFVKTALVPFKYPRTIEYLDELPKTGTDKIDRQRLRAMHSSKPWTLPCATQDWRVQVDTFQAACGYKVLD